MPPIGTPLSAGVTVEAIARPAAEHDLSAAQGLKAYMTSDQPNRLQYVRKVQPAAPTERALPTTSMEQLIEDIERELDDAVDPPAA